MKQKTISKFDDNVETILCVKKVEKTITLESEKWRKAPQYMIKCQLIIYCFEIGVRIFRYSILITERITHHRAESNP